jgi:hypothetical protein
MFHGFLYDVAFHTLLLPPGAFCDIADENNFIFLLYQFCSNRPAYAFCQLIQILWF